jgi:hypothetical protein
MNDSEQAKPLNAKQLLQFLSARMRMSHIYQPLLIRTLLQNDGQATVRQIASEFLAHDESHLKGVAWDDARVKVLKRREVELPTFENNYTKEAHEMATALKFVLRSALVIGIATLTLNGIALAKGPHKGLGKGHHKSVPTKVENESGQSENTSRGTGDVENSHSNKGGEERGLGRANEVAGPHGEEGRENAAGQGHGRH